MTAPTEIPRGQLHASPCPSPLPVPASVVAPPPANVWPCENNTNHSNPELHVLPQCGHYLAGKLVDVEV